MKKKVICFIILFFIFIFICISEYWIHIQDEYDMFNNKFALPYLIMSFIPFKNNLCYDNTELKLPYGYKSVNEYSAVGIINSINKLYDEMNKNYEYIDQFGSFMLWSDNNKYISITHVRRGGIHFLIMHEGRKS